MSNVKDISIIHKTLSPTYLCQSSHLEIKIDNERTIELKVYSSPFANCQNFSIADIRSLFGQVNNNSLSKEEALDLIMFISTVYGHNKKLLVIDINKGCDFMVVKLFKPEEILVSSDYKSTNGSHMRIYVLNLSKIDNRNSNVNIIIDTSSVNLLI